MKIKVKGYRRVKWDQGLIVSAPLMVTYESVTPWDGARERSMNELTGGAVSRALLNPLVEWVEVRKV